ncbi:MAG: Gfo/Idh/MocA family oxidoreductase [Armatimonadetes bacterium]|nr:Gfo/Idh/MocA family oxidoreductase [Armatimonadota bacterium]
MTRREVIGASAMAAASALMAGGSFAFAQGSDTLKVGLIGCGGRGTGAAHDCAKADKGVVIWALGDLFKDRLDGCRNSVKGLGNQYNVTDDRCFVGLDAYKQVIASGVDIVILATHPGFRPPHFKAAIEAGKHVFMEKPVGTDAPGIRTMLAASDMATQKKLSVVAGTQRRHQASYVETIKRIHDGAIGKVVGGQVYWNGGGVGGGVGQKQPGQTDLEWMVRHWYQFTWLCGDNIVEQHVHNIDIANWVLKAHPVKCIATGGRAQRLETEKFPQAFDNFSVDFVYPEDIHILSMCRHWDNTPGNVSERIVGTKGFSNPGWNIWGETSWNFSGDNPNAYVQEHVNLIKAIRSGAPINEGRQVAESTLTAIMGRTAAYTGMEITWEQILNSQDNMFPDLSDPKAAIPVRPPAVPGKTKFV